MRRPTTRPMAVALLVLCVLVAGCAGSGGDAAGTTATTTAGEAGSATAPTATPAGGTTAGSTDQADAAATTIGPDDRDGVSPAAHRAALRAAGNYTLTVDSGGSGVAVHAVERVDLRTGERANRLNASATEGPASVVEPNSPPGTAAASQHTADGVEPTTVERGFFRFARPGSVVVALDQPGAYEAAGSVDTDYGPATRYVLDDPADLPAATRERYGTVENVRASVVVLDDSGLILRYHYDLRYVTDGREGRLVVDVAVSDLGSTTVERPAWVPDD